MAELNQPVDFDGELIPQPGDTLLAIRDGVVLLRPPQHEEHTPVPEDFLVALGIAAAFGDPDFRHWMLALVRQQTKDGHLKGIISTEQHPVN